MIIVEERKVMCHSFSVSSLSVSFDFIFLVLWQSLDWTVQWSHYHYPRNKEKKTNENRKLNQIK